MHERRNRFGRVHKLLMTVHKFIIGLFIEAILAKNIWFTKVYPTILAKVLCCLFPWCLSQKALELNSKIFKDSHLNLQAVTCQNGMRKFYATLKILSESGTIDRHRVYNQNNFFFTFFIFLFHFWHLFDQKVYRHRKRFVWPLTKSARTFFSNTTLRFSVLCSPGVQNAACSTCTIPTPGSTCQMVTKQILVTTDNLVCGVDFAESRPCFSVDSETVFMFYCW